MTVKEFIEKLKEYPDNMRVILTWEGTANDIQDEDFDVDERGLWIDADNKRIYFEHE